MTVRALRLAADSEAVLDLLASSPGIERTLLAVVTADGFLAALGLDPPQRPTWLNRVAVSRREDGDGYRARKHELLGVLRGLDLLSEPVNSILVAYRIAVAPIADRLTRMDTSHKLTRPPGRIAHTRPTGTLPRSDCAFRRNQQKPHLGLFGLCGQLNIVANITVSLSTTASLPSGRSPDS